MSKRILITGAGRRLGKVLTEHYLAQGWQVVAHYNSANELADHAALTSVRANLADREDIRQLALKLPALGNFDAVIHNASCFVPDAAAQVI